MMTSPRNSPEHRQADSPVSDLHVAAFERLDSPDAVKAKLPCPSQALATVRRGRDTVRAALTGADDRLVMIVGPCSIHDPAAAMDYAGKLADLRTELEDRLIVIMRVYFEKPRTTVGWKGLINDPHVDGSNDINTGLQIACRLLMEINALSLPCAMEFLDPIIPQYTADLVTWAAIGARTTESQTHREMASGLSMPVGFKNATDGDLQVALDAMVSARHNHAFVGIDGAGMTCVVRTSGNEDVHLVLRGGSSGPNYGPDDVAKAKAALNAPAGERRILVDCGHGNTNKDYTKIPEVFRAVLDQCRAGEKAILGMMVESNLRPGRQDQTDSLEYGVSITDPCIGWPTTEQLLREAAE